MGIPCTRYLEGDKIWCCAHCRTHLASDDGLVSADFVGKFGRAKLFDAVANIDRLERRCSDMKTGTFVIQEIVCRNCQEYVGWTYVQAYKRSESYKEGKFILEDPTIAQYFNGSLSLKGVL